MKRSGWFALGVALGVAAIVCASLIMALIPSGGSSNENGVWVVVERYYTMPSTSVQIDSHLHAEIDSRDWARQFVFLGGTTVVLENTITKQRRTEHHPGKLCDGST